MAEKHFGRFFTSEQLSEHRSLTPEGFLLITDVPIARTGKQIYAANELPALEPSPDGLIIVERDPDEVFRPSTIASFNGKPFCDDHPSIGMLTPDSWRNFARGTVLNPRRGDGLHLDNDFLFADILVTDRDMIKIIQDGKKEISAGYDAEYETLGPGRARCLEIIGNHVALVDKGRCGPHCAIGDSDMAVKSATRTRFMDKFRTAVSRGNTRDALEAVSEVCNDPEALGEIISDEMGEMGEMGGGSGGDGKHHIETHVHLNGMNGGATKDEPPAAAEGAPSGDLASQLKELADRVGNIESVLMSLAEEEQSEGSEGNGGETGDRRGSRDEGEIRSVSSKGPQLKPEDEADDGYAPGKGPPELPPREGGVSGDKAIRDRAAVGDSSSMREAFVATLSKAETLCPGIRLPTFDAAAPARDTFDSLCNFRRKTLDAAYKVEDSRVVIDSVIEGRRAAFFDKEWTCDAIGVAFNGASSLMAQKIAYKAVHPRVGANGGNNAGGFRPPTPAELNAKARAFYHQDTSV